MLEETKLAYTSAAHWINRIYVEVFDGQVRIAFSEYCNSEPAGYASAVRMCTEDAITLSKLITTQIEIHNKIKT